MAVDADRVVVELVAETSGYTRSLKGAANDVQQATNTIERSSARAGNASRNLGRQISDIGTGLAGGQSPFLIIAQQAPQVADALADMEGRAAGVARFFAGPLGAALLAAASIAGVLAGKFLETGDAADKQKEKVRTLADAIKDLNTASNADISTESQRIAAGAAEVIRLGQQEIATRRLTKARLEAAIADATNAKFQGATNTGSFGSGGTRAAVATSQVAELRKQITQIDASLEKGSQSLRTASAYFARQGVSAGLDKATAATKRYANEERALLAEYKRTGDLEAYTKGERELQAARDAVTQAHGRGRVATQRMSAEERAAARSAREYAEALAKLSHEGSLALDLKHSNGDLLKSMGIDDASQQFKSVTDEIEKIQRVRLDAQGQAIEEGQHKEEESLRTLSGLYYDLFSGGTKSLWADFKDAGLRALAELAAKKTFAFIADLATGGSAGAASGILSLFGRASGGQTTAGQMYRVNEGASPGRVEGFVGPSTGGKIVPLGRMAAAQAGGSTTIINAPQFNLRGAVVTADLYADMQRISSVSASRAGAAAFKASQAAAPGRMQKLQNLGS